MAEPFDTARLSVRLCNALTNAGLVTPTFDEDSSYRTTRHVDRDKLAAMREVDLLSVKNVGRRSLEELRAHGLLPHLPGSPAVAPDLERLAAIGRAVVVHLQGADNHRAMREATPEHVVAHLRRREDEARAVANSRALRVGRLMLGLVEEVTRG